MDGTALTLTGAIGATLAMCVSACGGGTTTVRKTIGSASTGNPASVGVTRLGDTSAGTRDADGDSDSPPRQGYDRDDAETITYGHAANLADLRQIVTLVERYLAAAVAGDGKMGCSLMYGLFSEEFVEEEGEGSDWLHGTTCEEVISRLLRQDHQELTMTAGLVVSGARVSGDRGYALLGIGKKVLSSLLIHRVVGGWRIAAIVESGLP